MQRKHSVTDFLFTLTLFCVFALSALMVVIIGANVYRSTVASMSENYSTRTAVAYVGEKIREFDRTTAGAPAAKLCVFPGEKELPALSLYRQSDTAQILLYIYYYDGALRELATTDAYAPGLSPADGQPVAELTSAAFEQLENDLFSFEAVGKNGSEKLFFTLRSSR